LGSARSDDRRYFETLFELDTRLARAVAEASEPIITQMKLAWWRDRFAEDPSQWPVGEPLLAQLARWGSRANELGDLVDGWEVLALGEALTAADISAHATGRAAAWCALAKTIIPGVTPSELEDLTSAARTHAFADLKERGVDMGAMELPEAASIRFSRRLRPFAVLAGLARRALIAERPMLDGLPALVLALRLGLVGR